MYDAFLVMVRMPVVCRLHFMGIRRGAGKRSGKRKNGETAPLFFFPRFKRVNLTRLSFVTDMLTFLFSQNVKPLDTFSLPFLLLITGTIGLFG